MTPAPGLLHQAIVMRGIEGPPDLVVEVLSPSTAARDRGIKPERYRLFGVPEYWLRGVRKGTSAAIPETNGVIEAARGPPHRLGPTRRRATADLPWRSILL